MKENNKGRRNELTQLKYKKRLARWIAQGGIYHVDGEWVDDPNTAEAVKANAQVGFKHQAVLCSCYGCSGYYKYRRHEFKRETERLLKEFYQECE